MLFEAKIRQYQSDTVWGYSTQCAYSCTASWGTGDFVEIDGFLTDIAAPGNKKSFVARLQIPHDLPK